MVGITTYMFALVVLADPILENIIKLGNITNLFLQILYKLTSKDSWMLFLMIRLLLLFLPLVPGVLAADGVR